MENKRKDTVSVTLSRNTVPTGRKVMGPPMPLKQADEPRKTAAPKK